MHSIKEGSPEGAFFVPGSRKIKVKDIERSPWAYSPTPEEEKEGESNQGEGENNGNNQAGGGEAKRPEWDGSLPSNW